MERLNLVKLIDLWEEDCVYDKLDLSGELFRIPQLHSKYSSQISINKMKKHEYESDFALVKKKKIDYYSGRLSKEELDELGLEPFRFILKQDLSVYLDADSDLIEIKKKINAAEEAANFCDRVCKELTSRTYQLQNLIKWEMFQAGK